MLRRTGRTGRCPQLAGLCARDAISSQYCFACLVVLTRSPQSGQSGGSGAGCSAIRSPRLAVRPLACTRGYATIRSEGQLESGGARLCAHENFLRCGLLLQGAELSDAQREPRLVAWNYPVVWIGVEFRLLVCSAAEDTGTFHRPGIDTRRFDRHRIGQRCTRATEPV